MACAHHPPPSPTITCIHQPPATTRPLTKMQDGHVDTPVLTHPMCPLATTQDGHSTTCPLATNASWTCQHLPMPPRRVRWQQTQVRRVSTYPRPYNLSAHTKCETDTLSPAPQPPQPVHSQELDASALPTSPKMCPLAANMSRTRQHLPTAP
jgi:hypothetical protein